MAIQNNNFFTVLVSTSDLTGAAEISSSRETNVIGGGSVDEQTALLENSITVYTAVNRCVLFHAASVNDEELFSTTSTSYTEALQAPSIVGQDRQSTTVSVESTGRCKIFVYETSSATELANHEFSDFADTRKVETETSLTWSTTTDVYFKLMIKKTGSNPAKLYSVRVLENKTSV